MRNKISTKKKKPKGKYLPLGFLFVFSVIFLIIIAFLWRLIVLISQSTFDSKHQYTLTVFSDKDVKIISFMPDSYTISLLKVTGNFDRLFIGKNLEIPIDGKIIGNAQDDIPSFLKNYILSIDKNISGMNSIDIMKLWWYSKSVSANRIIEDTISLPANQDNGGKILQKLFTDKTIYQEAKTIKIINSTGIDGYGNRLAKLLTNIGCNIIVVTASNDIANTSTLTYATELSYTIKRIEKILNIQATYTGQKPIIADITITIGGDMIGNKIF